METLGKRLKQQRESRGLSLEEIATQTRISLNYLEAIEADDTRVIPGGFFFRSFVRQYARTIGLPDDFGKYELEVMVREEEAAEKEKEAIPREPVYSVPPIRLEGVPPVAETKKWALGFTLLAIVLVVCSLAYALYESFRTVAPGAKTDTAQQQAAVPEAPAPAPAAPQQTTEPAAPPAETKESSTSTVPASGTQAAPTPPQVPAVSTPPGSGAVRLVLKAVDNVWVQVVTGEDKVLFSDVLKAGTSKEFTSEKPIRVKTGNAGGVEIEYNGTAIPPLGPRGMVRTATFRKDGYDAPAAR